MIPVWLFVVGGLVFAAAVGAGVYLWRRNRVPDSRVATLEAVLAVCGVVITTLLGAVLADEYERAKEARALKIAQYVDCSKALLHGYFATEFDYATGDQEEQRQRAQDRRSQLRSLDDCLVSLAVLASGDLRSALDNYLIIHSDMRFHALPGAFAGLYVTDRLIAAMHLDLYGEERECGFAVSVPRPHYATIMEAVCPAIRNGRDFRDLAMYKEACAIAADKHGIECGEKSSSSGAGQTAGEVSRP